MSCQSHSATNAASGFLDFDVMQNAYSRSRNVVYSLVQFGGAAGTLASLGAVIGMVWYGL
ncbi:unnamed protein product, partial [Fusarium langsethiae]